MRVTSVELHPAGSSDVAVLSFRDPGRANRYNCKGISGLDPQDIVARYYSGSGGTAKYNMTMEKRNVGVRIELNPNFSAGETYHSLRDALYRMIASSRTGQLQIQLKDGATALAAVSGFIVKVEAPQFEKTQEVILTLECLDPILRGLAPVNLDVASLDPASTTITDALSTAPHGFAFQLAFTGAVASLSIDDPGDPSWSFDVTPVGGFLNGDVLHFSSEFNDKTLYVVRGGVTTHLADKIAPGSVWPIVFPGANQLVLTPSANLDWVSISYLTAYWGV